MSTSPSNAHNFAPLSLDDLTLILFGHSAFQYLAAGLELDVFPYLYNHPNSSSVAISTAVAVAEPAIKRLLFGLTALRLVVKNGVTYTNCTVINQWFDAGDWQILADIIRFESNITYLGQSDFAESLRTGRNIGIRHIPGAGQDLYRRLSQTPQLQDVFYKYMGSWSRLSVPILLKSVDFSSLHKIVDVGGGDGTIAIAIAQKYPHITITIVDLPSNCHIAKEKIIAAGLTDRISIWPADMFSDALPTDHDCFLFVHQLVIWPANVITSLLKRAYSHLPNAGKIVIFSSISSDSEDGPVMAALDSVYFVSIPAEGGMIHPWKLYEECLQESGFLEIQHFRHAAWTPHGAIVATK